MISYYIYISACIAILLISFLGIHLISKKIPWIIGTSSYNEKSTIFHEKMLRGLGIIYPVSIIPIFVFNQNVIEIIDYLMLLTLTSVGFIDDKFGLNYKIKIILFIIISFLYNAMIFSEFDNIQVFNLLLNSGLFFFLIIFFNQIDGINGLAIMTFIILFICISFLANSILLYLPLIFFSFPYLYYNLQGKIGIQGDTGSYFLAGIIFVIAKDFYQNEFSILILMFFLCPILIDLVVTTIVKLYYKQNIFVGHKDNIYQRLVIYSGSHVMSTGIFCTFQTLFCILTIYLQYNFSEKNFLIIMYLLIIIMFIFLLYISLKAQKSKIMKSHSATKI